MSRLIVLVLLALAHRLEQLSTWLYGHGTSIAIRNTELPDLPAPPALPVILPPEPAPPEPTPPRIRRATASAFEWPEPPVPLFLQSCAASRWPFVNCRVHADQLVRRTGKA